MMNKIIKLLTKPFVRSEARRELNVRGVMTNIDMTRKSELPVSLCSHSGKNDARCVKIGVMLSLIKHKYTTPEPRLYKNMMTRNVHRPFMPRKNPATVS